MYVHELVRDIRTYWMLYLAMPFIAAAIGYITKLVAIRMMFQPVDFVGKPPYLGWQGIIPRRAARMAAIACDTITTKLITPAEIFARLDPERVAREVEQPMLEAVEDITREVASRFQPGLWEAAPERLRRVVIRRIQDQAPEIIKHIMEDVRVHLDQVFDLKTMVVRALLRDKVLLNRIFQEAGHAEFRFIARSGIYFGFAIGCVQAVAWLLTHSPVVMPLFGGLTGWFTDWLALKMIFEPKQPRRYFGCVEWQGLFLKRRREVAAAYGDLIAQEVITPSNILEAVLRGPMSDRLFSLVMNEVRRVVDEQAGMARPLVVFSVGSRRYQKMKQTVAEEIMARLPDTMRHVERYAEDAMDIRNTLVQKMQELEPEEFEQLLRPAFQQDEWILIAVGAVLGFVVGELEVFLLLGG